MAEKLMLAVLKDKRGPGVSLEKIQIPKPSKDEVLVKVLLASICGTDISLYDWTPWAQKHLKPPVVLGHEIVGEVLQVNGKSHLKPGDLISSETHIFCTKCNQCKKGNYHICEKMQLFGIDKNGGFAQYTSIPLKTAWKNNPSLPLELMVIQEPLGNAMHVISRAGVKNKVVGIFGLGPIGLCSGLISTVIGAETVYALDPSSYRRALAFKMGLKNIYPDIPDQFVDKTDIVLEMSGNSEAISQIPHALKKGGKGIFFGLPKVQVPIDIASVIDKELQFEGVFGREIWKSWRQVQKLLLSKKVDCSKLITHRFKLSEFEKAVEVIKSGACGKILLVPE